MPKNYLVVFSESGARVMKDPHYIKEHKNDKNVLYNPILPHGVPLEYWRQGKNKITLSPWCGYSAIQLAPTIELSKKNRILKISLITSIILGIISNVIFHKYS